MGISVISQFFQKTTPDINLNKFTELIFFHLYQKTTQMEYHDFLAFHNLEGSNCLPFPLSLRNPVSVAAQEILRKAKCSSSFLLNVACQQQNILLLITASVYFLHQDIPVTKCELVCLVSNKNKFTGDGLVLCSLSPSPLSFFSSLWAHPSGL